MKDNKKSMQKVLDMENEHKRKVAFIITCEHSESTGNVKRHSET